MAISEEAIGSLSPNGFFERTIGINPGETLVFPRLPNHKIIRLPIFNISMCVPMKTHRSPHFS